MQNIPMNLFKTIAARLERTGRTWRGHLVRDAPNTTAPRRIAGIGGGMFTLLTLLVITICAGAVVALTQIKSLKTEIASLQRELLPLRERLARFDQAQKAKEAEIKAAAERKALAQNLSQQVPLTFSREEVQLIREYIKPAPFAGKQPPLLASAIPSPGARFPSPRLSPTKCPNCSAPDLPFAMASSSLSGRTAVKSTPCCPLTREAQNTPND